MSEASKNVTQELCMTRVLFHRIRKKTLHTNQVVIFIGIIGFDLPIIFALLPKSGKLLIPSMYSSLPSGITFNGYGNKCPTVFCWHMY